jgi:uncharacterized protein (UPF0332 family)
MTFAWKEYLDVALFLTGREVEVSEESKQRSAVSRAYYAAFGHAKEHAVKNKGFIPKGGGEDHSALRRFCQQHGMSWIERILNDLCSWREECDYDSEVPGLAEKSNESLNKSQSIIDGLR